MREVVQQHLLPWLRDILLEDIAAIGGENALLVEEKIARHCVLLQPPMTLPPGVASHELRLDKAQMRRGKVAPAHGSFYSYIVWPDLGLHTMPYAWLGFLFEGEADIRIGASRNLMDATQQRGKVHVVTLKAPAFFAIPPGVPHPDGSRLLWEASFRAQPCPPQRIFWMHISPAGVRCHLSRVAHQLYQEEFFLMLHDEALMALAHLLLAEMQRAPRFDLVVGGALLSLLQNTQRCLQLETPSDAIRAIAASTRNTVPSGSARDNRRVVLAAALHYIETHLNWRTLSVDDIAAHAHVSPSHLNRIVHLETGLTVKQYITRARLEVAKSLLVNSDMAIAEVGFLTGYFPPSHFTRAFLRGTGASPKDFRKAQRETRTKLG